MKPDFENRLNKLEDKLDEVLARLSYLSATDNEKKYMYPNGSTNYNAIYKSCDDICLEMIEMRTQSLY